MNLNRRVLLTAIPVLLLQQVAEAEPVEIVMITSEGPITLELYIDRAPVTATNFLRLVDGEHLDGAAFYRVVSYETDNGSPKIEVIQGGLGAGRGPYNPIEHETTGQTGIRHVDGVISMARGAVGTATSEFFICIGDQPALDYGQSRSPDKQGFAAFGRVVDGMDIARKIKSLPVDTLTESAYIKGQILRQPVSIESVRRK